MSPNKIMLIRHAEKPSRDGSIGGVTENGRSSPDDLSVQGWQRAGALVQYFAQTIPERPGIQRPQHLLASGISPASHSVRSVHTLSPLASYLGLRVRTTFVKGQETQLAEAVDRLDGVVLIAWSHDYLPPLGRALMLDDSVVPRTWPEDRFDIVWVLDRRTNGWNFTQIPQILLAGDSHRTLA